MSPQYIIDVSLKRNEIDCFDHYPFSLDAVRSLNTLSFHPHVTYIIGENGSGKSTLLEGVAVAMGFNAEGGSTNFGFNTRSTHSELGEHLQIAKGVRRPKTGFFLRAESFYNVATAIDVMDEEFSFSPPIINSYGGVSLHKQSHGESFLALMTHRFGANGLYILDEPEAALSPQRQLAVLSRIHELVGLGSQFVIATHSPILMAYPDSLIYHCGPGGLSEIDYEDTEHYLVTRDFLMNRERMLSVLFDDQ